MRHRTRQLTKNVQSLIGSARFTHGLVLHLRHPLIRGWHSRERC